MKKLDEVIGSLAASLLPPPLKRSPPDRIFSVLLIRPGGIGDAVLLIPAILAIRKQYPEAEITLLAEKRNVQLFKLCPDVGATFCYDHPYEFIRALKRRYDVVIDTEQSHRLSAVVARLVRAPVKIGFDTNERRRMFTNSVPYDQYAYETDNFCYLLKVLGIACQHNCLADNLTVPYQSSISADRLLQALPKHPFITIFAGASIYEKRWAAENFRQVAESLSAFGIGVVIVGGKEDRKRSELIAAGGLGLNLAGLTSLSETAAVIRKSAVLLSGDSGLLHIAAALGVPTVSLFGPGRVAKWAPLGDHHTVINKELPCSPCTTFGNTPTCPNSNGCMRGITVDEVVMAVTDMLIKLRAIAVRDLRNSVRTTPQFSEKAPQSW